MASECVETKDGLYVWEDHFYPEVIDPRSGKVLPDGERGELVFTSLTKEAMPVIHYRTRDLTRLLPGRARTMRCMGKIAGRSDDMIVVRGVNVFPTQIEEQVLHCDGLTRISSSNCGAMHVSIKCGSSPKRGRTMPKRRVAQPLQASSTRSFVARSHSPSKSSSASPEL
jgi:phenylacetate-CoA ligase